MTAAAVNGLARQQHRGSRAASIAARIGMSRIAERMHPNYGPSLRTSDPVAYADAVATMSDYRAALCLARGVPVEDIDRNGFDLTRHRSSRIPRRAADPPPEAGSQPPGS